MAAPTLNLEYGAKAFSRAASAAAINASDASGKDYASSLGSKAFKYRTSVSRTMAPASSTSS